VGDGFTTGTKAARGKHITGSPRKRRATGETQLQSTHRVDTHGPLTQNRATQNAWMDGWPRESSTLAGTTVLKKPICSALTCHAPADTDGYVKPRRPTNTHYTVGETAAKNRPHRRRGSVCLSVYLSVYLSLWYVCGHGHRYGVSSLPAASSMSSSRGSTGTRQKLNELNWSSADGDSWP